MYDIQQIKDRLDIVEIIGELVKLNRYGKGFCPFHDERTPSFSVSAKKQWAKCFGSCGFSGSVIDFYAKFFHISTGKAIRALGERAGVLPVSNVSRRLHPFRKRKVTRRYRESRINLSIGKYADKYRDTWEKILSEREKLTEDNIDKNDLLPLLYQKQQILVGRIEAYEDVLNHIYDTKGNVVKAA